MLFHFLVLLTLELRISGYVGEALIFPPSMRPHHQSSRLASTPIEYEDFKKSTPSPNSDLNAYGVVDLCMQALLDGREDGSGLDVCFAFSSDRCRVRRLDSFEKRIGACPVSGASHRFLSYPRFA
jgi:hypothetical protein